MQNPDVLIGALPQEMTPARIVTELDKYIIGQQAAKRAVAIALRNRWRRMRVRPEMRKEIMPNNILMIGATGVGKTEIARRLAQLAGAPFIKVEASKFTEVGYVGRDVESMVRDLVEFSLNMVREEMKALVRARAAERAEEVILDILIPPVSSGEDAELNARTREKFREKLRNGELDSRNIDIEVTAQAPQVQVMGPPGMEGMEGLQDLLANMMPQKKKTRNVSIAEARELLTEEEAQKLLDMEAVQREAIARTENSGIIFIDEIDKVVRSGSQTGGADVSREGVQRDLLPIVEGSVVNTRYGTVRTDHVLFIAAGAFHLSKPADMIPELQGRFPIRVELNPLTEQDFILILTNPENALTKQYQALMETEGVRLSFQADALAEIARLACQVNEEVENIGARRLHTILSTLLEDMLFQVPDLDPTPAFTITSDFVRQKLTGIVQQKDLSQYIL
ncbi:MAG: ATP-dependent protease ATPase subunit HslU [Bacteroidetes bacterium]|nr:ATP-dependent protease ATPase subunit HslU [Bacteroidota bacterium]